MGSKEMSQFAIIGLGRFGKSLAKKLYDMDKDVLVIDDNEDNVNSVQEYVTHSIVADATEEGVLKAVGIKNFDVVAVCIGSNMEASILVTLMCKEMGAKYVVSKAQSHQHQIVLEKIGADLVIFPEEYMGKKTATMLINPNIEDSMELAKDYKIIEVKPPQNWIGKRLIDINIRKNYNVSVILIKKADETSNASPGGDSLITANCSLVLGGNINDISKFSQKVLD